MTFKSQSRSSETSRFDKMRMISYYDSMAFYRFPRIIQILFENCEICTPHLYWTVTGQNVPVCFRQNVPVLLVKTSLWVKTSHQPKRPTSMSKRTMWAVVVGWDAGALVQRQQAETVAAKEISTNAGTTVTVPGMSIEYVAGERSAKQLLRRCSHLVGPKRTWRFEFCVVFRSAFLWYLSLWW